MVGITNIQFIPRLATLAVAVCLLSVPVAFGTDSAPARHLFWGDTHLHTSLSGDAFASGTRMGPEQAYRFARGEAITLSTGQRAKLSRPLDFLVIADHAEGFGTMKDLYEGNELLMVSPQSRRWHKLMRAGGDSARVAKDEIINALGSGKLPPEVTDPKVVVPLMRSAWKGYTATAENFNEPGRFTALIGYEWTSVPGGNNLHRVVMFRDGKERTDQIIPFSALQSEDPEQLWAFLQRYETRTGGRALAIPHNSNLSNGRMFEAVSFSGNPMDTSLAARRAQWEPVVEVTQMKGDSESHSFLSPNDEFADFGNTGWDLGNLSLTQLKKPEHFATEYVREALKSGLALQQTLGVNPFRFGMIGSTDSHTGLSTADDDNFFGKEHGAEPGTKRTTDVIKEGNNTRRYGWQTLAGGYAAAWAEDNTREAIWDAFARREVYATTGPRITVRFFGGWDFTAEHADVHDLAAVGYKHGVTMGSDLTASTKADSAPRFLIAAARDPEGANLDRIQVVKGWLDEDAQLAERVYNVVWSAPESRALSPASSKLAEVGSTVDLSKAGYDNSIGAPELRTVWEDPDFNADHNAFYYLRILEIPTPRWVAYDVAQFGAELPAEAQQVTQQRAYSSPIWYTPSH